MKDYTAYDLQDFLQDDGFRDWVQGKNASCDSFWNSFQKRYPDKTEAMKQAVMIIRAVGHTKTTAIDSKEERIEIETFLAQIADDEDQQTENGEKQSGQWITRLLWAGAAAVLLSLTFFPVSPNKEVISDPDLTAVSETPVTRQGTNLVKTENETDKPLRIVLSDNSIVVLSPNSTLSYPSHFPDSSRTIHLTGEADFSVTKHASPFVVYAGDVVTKVLGTQFVVKAFEKDVNTTVHVRTGTVSVFKKEKQETGKFIKKDSGLIITANQAAVFEKDIRQLTKTLVPDPVRLPTVSGLESKRYDEAALNKIFSDLEKTYGIAILFDKEQFKKCKITATLADENMYQKLDMLCKSIDATYEIVDGRILIIGKGC